MKFEVNDKVHYIGGNRGYLNGREGTIQNVSPANRSYFVDFGDNYLEWVGEGALKASENKSEYSDLIKKLETEVLELEQKYDKLVNEADDVNELRMKKNKALIALRALEAE